MTEQARRPADRTEQHPLGQQQIRSWFARPTPATWRGVVELDIADGTPHADLCRALQEVLRTMGPPLPRAPRPRRPPRPQATLAEIIAILDVAGANPTGIGAYDGPGRPEKITGAGGGIGRSIRKGWIEQYEVAADPKLPGEYTHRYRPTPAGWEQVRLMDRYRETSGPRISPEIPRPVDHQDARPHPGEPGEASSAAPTLDLSARHRADIRRSRAQPGPAGCLVPQRSLGESRTTALGVGGPR
jgi:hypothetical protein